jgi:hypothetical protein
MLELQSVAFRSFGEWNHSVKLKRILVGTLAALLLCVSSLLPACDLSCGFLLFRSDCHSSQIAAAESDASEMAMAGMTMPESASDSLAHQSVVPPVPQKMPAHAALAEMGACARQSCDQAPGLVTILIHSAATQFEKISGVTGFSGMERPKIVFHDARDDISPPDRAVHLSLDVSLRI